MWDVVATLVDRVRGIDADRPFECLHCGTQLDVEYYICPECGSFAVDQRHPAPATIRETDNGDTTN